MFEYSLVGLTAGRGRLSATRDHNPSVSYVVRTEGFATGIMISANIIQRHAGNGIKVINERGSWKKGDGEIQYLDGGNAGNPSGQKDRISRTVISRPEPASAT